jgi:hypothetical protein
MGTERWLAVGAMDGDYNNISNWSGDVPGSTDTALFGLSSKNILYMLSPGADAGGWTFLSGASEYFISIQGGSSTFFSFYGAGIVVNGGAVEIDNYSYLRFLNDGTSAGAAYIINQYIMQFFNGSTGGSANITNDGLSFFKDHSTAGMLTSQTTLLWNSLMVRLPAMPRSTPRTARRHCSPVRLMAAPRN